MNSIQSAIICCYFMCGFLIGYNRTQQQTNETLINCTLSLTTVNGKQVCESQLIFQDNFETINYIAWNHVVKISSVPDYEFSIYHGQNTSTYVKNNTLFLKPFLPFVKLKHIKLRNCTGIPETEDCERSEVGFNLIPPTAGARITTSNSFSFKYGVVQIEAKMPVGDWILPELWLLPKLNNTPVDDSCYQYGRIRIAMARGNRWLKCQNSYRGNQFLEGGIAVGEKLCSNRFKQTNYAEYETNPWPADFHQFTLIWTPDNISFLVDGDLKMSIFNKDNDTVKHILELSDDDITAETRLSPFDREFYLHLGVSVGGMTDFPDACITGNNTAKPWSNLGAKAVLNFWEARKIWNATWIGDNAALKIKSVTVTAL